MEITLKKQAGRALYMQVADALRDSIAGGSLSGGERLPATRALAAQLGVHRHTIAQAYRTLEQQGLVRLLVGAGTFVAARAPGTDRHAAATAPQPPFSWLPLLSNAQALAEDPAGWLTPRGVQLPKSPIQLTGAVAAACDFPLADFSECMRSVLAERDPQLLDYGPPEGYLPLRSWIAERLGKLGVPQLDAARVFITNGSQQGLDLVAKLLLAPQDWVIAEAPTYTAAFVVLRHAGARIATVPVGDDGLSVDALAALLEREPAKFLYTMPGYQNPTGVTLGAASRAGLLEIARRHGLAIVEDHYDSDLHYSGGPPRPLLADDPDGQTIHLGTFSKMLFPGLRLGWMVVPTELVESVRRLRWAADLSSATLTQRVMDRFCRRGYVDKHLTRLRERNGRRLQAMLAALEAEFPRAARWTRPSGGMTLWCELPAAVNTLELFHEAARRGVLFSPGIAFFPNGGGGSAMRLTFNRESEARIRHGIGILGEMIAERLRASAGKRSDAGGEVPCI